MEVAISRCSVKLGPALKAGWHGRLVALNWPR